MEASLRGDRKKTPDKYTFTPVSVSDIRSGQTYYTPDDAGRMATVKITSVKTWKTRPDVEVHWKYGLYEYGHETIRPGEEAPFYNREC
jgi:hypothetical protein